MAQTITESRTLRLFGVSTAQASAVLRQAAAEGCPGLRLMGRDGELAVRFAAGGLNAAAICNNWEKRLREQFGPAVFSGDATDLPQAALDAFLKEEFLFCTADKDTGALLEPLLKNLPQASSVYDFGQESWAHPRKAKRIEPPSAWLRRWPACPVQPVAGRAAAALKVSEADFALAFLPAQDRHPAFALLADERSAWVKALNQSQAAPAQAGLWLLDMARRAAMGLPQADGVQMFRLGKEAPALVADPEQTPAPQPAPPAASPSGPVEPLRLAPDPDPQPTRIAPDRPDEAPPRPSEPTGVIRLEPVGRNARLEQAAQAMYGLVDEDAVPDTEPPVPRKKGGYWGRILAAVFFLLVVAVAAAAGLYYWNSLGEAPAWRSYGTAGFDANAISYLERAQAKDEQVAGYLALPGMTGSLIYTDGQAQNDAPAGAALAAEESAAAPERVCYAPGADPAAAASHSMVLCPAQALRELGGLDQLDAVQNNSAFTLYTGTSEAAAYRYKVAAVFYWDPAEEGEGAFDLADFTDLSDENRFMDFVVGVKARSLFDMPVDFEEGDSFVSLVADAAEPDGTKLVVVGRQVRQQETRSVDTANIAPTTDPLLTAAMYAASGSAMPDLLELMKTWVNWFGGRNQTNADLQIEAGMPEEEIRLDAVLDSLGEVPDLEDLMPTMEPDPTPHPTVNLDDENWGGGTGDTGLPPETTLPPVTTPNPTPNPTPDTTQNPEPTSIPDGGGQTTEPTPVPSPEPTPAPVAATINVTMNGTPQTMDLNECLAMIVMNEIGSSAPAEAQKAQAIAAHSWILSQGTAYPSVAGRTPTDSVRANVAQVAHIVVASGSTVAFTPYHASCAGGTTSSADVWGGYRSYLVEVDSPYDASTATNWQTTETYSSATVAARAKEKLGVDLTGDPSTWLEITSTTTYGYVKGIRIGTVTKSGTYLQSTLLGSQIDIDGRKRTIRSPAFTVQYDAGRDAFVFTVRGYGHGVGMSQWGAIGYARAGWDYSQILAHYYPGTTLVTVG